MLINILPPLSLYKFATFNNGGSISSAALTAGGKIGFVFEAPKSGVIDRIVWYSGTATGSPTVDLRLETVSGSAPSGTLWATNTNAITGTLVSNTEYETTLTAGVSVTKGDLLGISWNYNSGTSIGIGFNPTAKTLGSLLNTPQINTAGSWSNVVGRAVKCLLRYQNEAYVSPNVDSVAYGTAATAGFFTTGEKGIRFQLPCKARLTGVWMQSDVRSNITLKLYDGSTSPGGTALLSKLFSSASLPAVGTSFNEFYFDSTHILDAGTPYRLVTAFSAGTGTRYNLAIFGSSNRRDAIVSNQYYTESSGSAWIDTVTQVPAIGLIIDQIDDGATGGGGVFDPLTNPFVG
jgi:hypothetical protein